MKQFVVTSQLNMIFVKILILFGIVNVFNCELYLIKEDDHVKCFDGNNSVPVTEEAFPATQVCRNEIAGKLY